MNKLRGFAYSFMFFFISLLLTSCWDQINIEDRGFVIGIAVDLSDEEVKNEITVMNQLIIPSKLGGVDQKSGAEKQYTNVSVSGSSLFEIDQKTTSTTARQPFYDHTKVVILSGELAKKPGVFESLLDGFLRDRKVRRSMRVFIASGKASDILEINTENDKSPAMYIDSLIKSRDVNLELIEPLKLGDLHTHLLNNDGYVINHIIPSDVRIQSEGVSVFDGYTNQMVGMLNNDETKGFKLISRKNIGGIINFNIDDFLMVYSIDRTNATIKIDAKDPRQIEIAIHIEAKGSIAEMFGSESLLNDIYVEEIEEKVNDRIEELAKNTLKKAQVDLKVDFLGFSNHLRRGHYDVWQQIKEDWDRGENLFSKSNITVSATSEVISIGPIDRTKDKKD